MTGRTRRTLLAGAGLTIATVGAGCLDETSDPGSGSDDEPSDGDGTDDGADDDGAGGDDEDGEAIDEEPRVDEPPHAIERPDVDDEDDPWEAWDDHYLGAEMATEPTVEFDTLSGVRLAAPALRYGEIEHGESAYAVRLVDTEDELGETIDLEASDDDSRTTLDGVDFDDRVVIVVESGFGSGSVDQRWARIEAVDDGLHLHGYYTQPYEQTDDIASYHSVLVADRPDETDPIALARASLTVSEDRRVHVNSTEGLVTVET
ncbi:hypothetical protein ACFO5R_06975 [Halosolutus amylolyticus]|uniref:Uncharacterized protein n=1 Tax=Halosolutus amylolyticus TaxID=2932267 RepID=A0ABD5PNQ0_9EURY|nr:hypothetical protein [Halosolutus amylolyticus]